MHARSTIYSLAASLAAATLLSCGGSQPRRDLTVTSYSPTMPVDRATPIEVRFDRPVIEAAAVGAAIDAGAIQVTPALAWTGHWLDRQTIILEPDEALRPGTRYTVELAGALAARSGGFSFAFVNRPLVLDGVVGLDPAAIGPADELPLTFNLPVSAARVVERCALHRDGAATALVTGNPGATDRTVVVRAAAPLARGASYTLTCDGLTADGGDAPMDAAIALALRVRPPLGVTRFEPSGHDVPADEVALELELTAPVALDAIRAAVTSEPAIPGLADGYLDGSGTRYRVVADLDTETDYQITIAGLVDLHGETLAAPIEHSFRTGDATPRISMERGLYALEAAAAGYPIWTRNVPSYHVECAQVPKAKLVQLLTTEMNYDPWGGNDDGGAIDWAALGLQGKQVPITVEGAKNKWHLDNLDLGETCGSKRAARGVYLADVSSETIAAQVDRPWWSPTSSRVMVNVTDLGVLLKVGPASGLVWVTSLATGQPVAGAKVVVYSAAGKQVWVDLTDKQGLIKMPGSAKLLDQPSADDTEDLEDEGGEWEDWDSYRSQRMIAVVEKGADLAVVDGNWANGIQIWNFGVPEERRGGATQIRGFIQSDRGLYRPGETVHFKGIVRELASGKAPKVPRRAPVAVEVTDSRGSTVFTGQAPMSKFGGFAFDLPINPEASVGDWYVSARVADKVFRERFAVEEFRPATYEVELTGGERTARLGERLDLAVDARYLFGAPVAGATVDWNVSRRRHWLRFAGFAEYTFEDNGDRYWWWDGDRDSYGDFVSDGSAVTDDQGHLAIVVRDPDPSLTGPYDYVVNATVTDEADQSLSAAKVITAHQTDLYLGLHTQEFVQAAGMPFAINVVAVAPDGDRVASKARLTVIRKVRDCTWNQLGARSYHSCTSRDEIAIERDLRIAATGTQTERIYPEDPGDYLIKLETEDSRGNPVLTSSMVWVIGKGEAFWSGDESARMTLIASKARYQPGDTARLVAQANLTNPVALVTIERDGIISAEVRTLGAASEGVELTIDDAWAPNVFASVAMVSGRQGEGDRHRPQFKMGVVELKVDSSHKRLDVAVQLDEQEVRPGAPVSGRVIVTSGGKPVSAELSLSVADEGVLQLIAYQTPDPMRTFYATWGLGIDSGTNWNRLARLADPEAGDPDEGGDMAGSDGPKVRSKFVSSAYWASALVTGEDGVASFTFTAPDNLTAFRLMAVAADRGDRFGSGDTRLTVNKKLMAIPVLPRFVGAGDVLSVGVLIHNHTGKAGTAKVTIAANGLSVTDTTEEVAVAAGGSARVRFAATASQNASASVELDVTMNGERDALRLDVPIRRPRVIDATTVAKGVGTGAPVTVEVPVGAGALRGESELVVTVDRTGLGDLEPSLRYLIEYPYGCLEQTLSRFIPLAKAKDLATSLGFASLSGTKADAFIKAGVAKVARHQQGDGHFSLWPQSQTYPHLTAYAVWGLTEARKAGAAVPDDVLARGLEALAGWLTQPTTIGPDNEGATAAMAAYVLALHGKADAGAMARLYDLRATLPRWGQAFLLRALIAGKASQAMIDDVERELIAAITVDGDTARVSDPVADDHFYMGSDARATAMALAALLDSDPAHALIGKLVAGLDGQRRPDGRWVNTQDNLWGLVALSDYARRVAPGKGSVEIASGETLLSKKKLSGAEVLVSRTRLDKLGVDQVTITASKGVHYAVRLVEARKDGGAAVSRGFTLRRDYLDADGKVVTRAKAGALVTVQLTLVVDADQPWVALVDPLPAGLEAVNPALATSGNTGATTTSSGGHRYWNPPTWAHTELRDDRVLWFSDAVNQGTHVMTYKARATIDGTFAVPPATVEAMYEPDVRGRNASTSFTVTR